jgi:hypothetical protein
MLKISEERYRLVILKPITNRRELEVTSVTQFRWGISGVPDVDQDQDFSAWEYAQAQQEIDDEV